jgi:ribosome maturation protein Sdo1
MKIVLKGRVIPRGGGGDPGFVKLARDGEPLNEASVLEVFTPAEVVELVNRALYQLEYQAGAHRKRAAAQRVLERPVKLALRIIHPGVGWAKATDSQIADAMEYARVHPELGE